MEKTENIFITNQDYERLGLLIHHSDSPNAEILEEELGRANVVEQKDIPQDIVTMNSKIKFVAIDSGKESEITLVYPKDADVT